MKNVSRFIAIVVLFSTLSAFTPNDTISVEGNWVGEYTAVNNSVPFKVHFWTHNDELKGTISVSNQNTKEFPLSWVSIENSRIHFEFVRPSGTLVFDGFLSHGKIAGDLSFSSVRGKFQLASEKLVSL